jgi:excisionase family DNA binding protein
MEKLLSPEEVAEILGVSPKMVRDWLRAGRIKGIKLGRIWRVRESDLEAFIKSLETGQGEG